MLLTSGRNIDRIARHRLLYVEEARRLLAAGNAARAVELCRHGLIYFPEDHTGYVLLADAFIMLGERERAMNVLADGYRRTGSPRLDRLRAEIAGEVPAAGASTPEIPVEEAPVGDVVEEAAPRSAGRSDVMPAAALLDEDALPSPADESTVPIADELHLDTAEAWHEEIEISEIEPGSPPHTPASEVIVPNEIPAGEFVPGPMASASTTPDAIEPEDGAETSDIADPGVSPSAVLAVEVEDDDRSVDLDALDRVQDAIAIAMAQVQALRPPLPTDEPSEPAALPIVEPSADDAHDSLESGGPRIDATGSDTREGEVKGGGESDVGPTTATASASEGTLERSDPSVAGALEQAFRPEAAQDEAVFPASVEPIDDVRTAEPDDVFASELDAGAVLSDESAVDAYPEADLLIAVLPEPAAVDPLVVWRDALPEARAQEDAAGDVADPVINAEIGTAEAMALEPAPGEFAADETAMGASSVDEAVSSDPVRTISPEFVEGAPERTTSLDPSVPFEYVARVENPEPVVEHVAVPESVDPVETPEAVAGHAPPAEIAERPRSLGLALHTVKNAARLRSSNLRLIPGLEFAPLRREDAGRHQSIAPLINEPMPQPELPPRRASLDAATMPPLPELEHDGGAAPPPMTPPMPSATEHAAEGGSAEGERMEAVRERVPRVVPVMQLPSSNEALTPLDELARRLERARIPVIDEAEQRMAFEPSLVSETLANILVAQGAYAEALKAFQTLARAKPERLEYFRQRIDEIEQHLERQTNG